MGEMGGLLAMPRTESSAPMTMSSMLKLPISIVSEIPMVGISISLTVPPRMTRVTSGSKPGSAWSRLLRISIPKSPGIPS